MWAVGLAVICVLKAKGFEVIASDPHPQRRQLALTLGADQVVNPVADSAYEAWIEASKPPGYEPPAIVGMLDAQIRPLRGF